MASVIELENGLRFGKTPARPGAVKLKMSDYLDASALPTPPADFGHENLVQDWPMLGNDEYGDCVFAGSLHQVQLYNRERGKTITPTDSDALSNYSQLTGFDRNDPSTDQGADMEEAAKYWRQTGMLTQHSRHRIAAYAALTPGDLDQARLACYLFGAVGIGIEFPAFAMDQFNSGQPWDVSKHNTSIQGGHYIPMVASRQGDLYVVTWAKLIRMTPAFYRKYCDEVVVHFSHEMLVRGKSLEGFRDTALLNDLQEVTHN